MSDTEEQRKILLKPGQRGTLDNYIKTNKIKQNRSLYFTNGNISLKRQAANLIVDIEDITKNFKIVDMEDIIGNPNIAENSNIVENLNSAELDNHYNLLKDTYTITDKLRDNKLNYLYKLSNKIKDTKNIEEIKKITKDIFNPNFKQEIEDIIKGKNEEIKTFKEKSLINKLIFKLPWLKFRKQRRDIKACVDFRSSILLQDTIMAKEIFRIGRLCSEQGTFDYDLLRTFVTSFDLILGKPVASILKEEVRKENIKKGNIKKGNIKNKKNKYKYLYQNYTLLKRVLFQELI